MSYRKLKADHLFDGNGFIPGNPVLVMNSDHSILDIIPSGEAGEDVEIFSGILSPGFVNAHCHLELSHMKGLIPKGTGLVDFVFKVVTDRHFADNDIHAAIQIAEGKMHSSGVVAVGDICNNLSTFNQKREGNLSYYNFIEASGWLPEAATTRFERSKEFYHEFKKISGNVSIIPHAPYSVSDGLWDLISPYFEHKVVSIHNQEAMFEDEFFMHGTGDLVRMFELMKINNSFFTASKKSSLQTYFHKLSKAASVILVHNTFTRKDDIDFLKLNNNKQLISFCLCVNANLYIESTLPPLETLIGSGFNIVLGTDSLASNHSVDMLEEMKTIQQYFPSVTLEQMLRWVTSNGAEALMMNDKLGSFEKGKQPGVVLIENLDGMKLTDDSSSLRIL